MIMNTTRTRLAVATASALLFAGAPAAYATLTDAGTRPTAATAPAALTVPAARGAAYVETRLFFGTERPDGGPAVTDGQFMDFVDRQVTPAFPDGLTVQEGRGQWRDRNGVIERERSYELILLYPVGRAKAADPGIEGIRDAYEKEFGQESVARLDEPTRADF
ncbi:DUF3574 domain-containing protein [Streptomyces phaeochromogenes]|uniref:DUF3574 domain-containing protein n=1 Tax=Streptomyces phaeochromogenes TaxID=1923 RepID=UPI002DDB35AA|nr:DUF3574 domain-containing protein [Streptomyces phaeochromogenes]WRZ33414.1 DUF3574 domain-containing protein [Streptomyces phaeochromogenes]